MDQNTSKSLYDAKPHEIASKHFLAGFSQALGGFVVTILSWVVIYFVIVNLLLPEMTKTLSQLEGILKLLPKGATTQTTTKETTIEVPDDLMKQIQQLQN